MDCLYDPDELNKIYQKDLEQDLILVLLQFFQQLQMKMIFFGHKFIKQLMLQEVVKKLEYLLLALFLVEQEPQDFPTLQDE